MPWLTSEFPLIVQYRFPGGVVVVAAIPPKTPSA
jgi:hypothetical protein